MSLAEEEITMASNGTTYQAVALQDGTSAVMRADSATPQIFEVVATFFDASRAQEYAARENAAHQTPQHSELAAKAQPEAKPHIAKKPAPKKRVIETSKVEPETPPRPHGTPDRRSQSAPLEDGRRAACRSKIRHPRGGRAHPARLAPLSAPVA